MAYGEKKFDLMKDKSGHGDDCRRHEIFCPGQSAPRFKIESGDSGASASDYKGSLTALTAAAGQLWIKWLWVK